MELREIVKIFGEKGVQALFGAIVIGAVAWLVSAYWPASYQASATVYVQKRPEKPSSGDYAYDGYYAQQTAEAYTDTVQGFLESLDIYSRAAEIAGLPSSTQQLLSYQKRTKVEKVAPQLIAVSVRYPKPQEARALILALAQATQEQAGALSQEGNAGMGVDLLIDEPLLKMEQPNAWLNALVASLVFFTLFIFSLVFVKYLKYESK